MDYSNNSNKNKSFKYIKQINNNKMYHNKIILQKMDNYLHNIKMSNKTMLMMNNFNHKIKTINMKMLNSNYQKIKFNKFKNKNSNK